MGRHREDSSPDPSPDEIEIKVQPRRSDPHPVGGPPRHRHRSRPPAPPPRPYKPFKKWFPWLVPTIIVVNIVLFVISMHTNDCKKNSSDCIGGSLLGRFAFQPLHENPLLGPSAATLQEMGALVVKRVVENHEVWRVFTCMWLHAGVFHVLANMLSLVFVGFRLEQEFGFVRIGLLYVLSGVGGSLLSALFIKNTISVGASGALFGLLGAMLSELLTNWTIYENKMAALMTLLLIIAINLAVGILPHVDNFAHLGGFVTGFLIGFVLLVRPQYGYVSQKASRSGYYPSSAKSKYKAYQYLFLIISLIILLFGFISGFIFLLRGADGNDYCSWCHHLSCIPTSLWSCTEARCTSSQLGKELNMTCIPNHKTGFYRLDEHGIGNSTAELEKLCAQLCK